MLRFLAFISLFAVHPIAAQPDLSGKWSRLGGASDNPWEKIQIALGKSVVEGRSDSDDVFNQSTLVHRSPDKDALRRRLLRFAGLLDRIDLEQKRNELKVSFRGVYRETYRLDGKAHSTRAPDGTRIEATAGWRNDELVLELLGADGTKVTETHSLIEDGRRLVILFQMESELLDRPLSIRSVYERITGIR
jgi:hypothetical protein